MQIWSQGLLGGCVTADSTGRQATRILLFVVDLVKLHLTPLYGWQCAWVSTMIGYLCIQDGAITRAAYSSLLNKMTVPPTCENRILNSGFNRDNIHDVYLLPFTVTKQAKLIAFQYKIIHNVLPNQVSLFHAGITENATCPLCSCEKQTTAHMLFNCTKSAAFWNSFVKWWHQKFNQIVHLNECIILYGWHKNTV